MEERSKTCSQSSLSIVHALEAFGPLYRNHVGRHLPSGVSEARLRALAALAAHGELTMSELREQIGGTAQNVTGIIDALERDGDAVRRQHPTDRRKTVISLADATRTEVLEKREQHREAIAALFETLPEAERQNFHQTLKKLVSHLEEEAGS